MTAKSKSKVTGEKTMTDAEASSQQTLCEEAGEVFDEPLARRKYQRIEEL